MRAVFVHGACVKDGGWWWHLAAAELETRGVKSIAAALPSCGEEDQDGVDGAGGTPFERDVASLRRTLLDSPEPTTIVAHSYGGIVTAQAATGVETVSSLILIASYLPEVGESLSSFAGEEPAPFLQVDLDDGTFRVRRDLLVETFLQDCTTEIATEAAAHLAAQDVSVTGAAVTASAWREVPSTYIVTAQDRGTPPEMQRAFSQRATHVVEFDTGHHPFLSRPDLVADVVTAAG